MSRARVKPARRSACRLWIAIEVEAPRDMPGFGGVEHVRVRVDQAGQHGGLAEIDHLRVRRDLHLRLGPDIGDALALQHHHLVGQHLAALAVEQAAGADRHHAGGRCALKGATFRPEARLCSGSSPGSGRSPLLRPHCGRERGRDPNANCGRFQRGCVSHRNSSHVLNSYIRTRRASGPPGYADYTGSHPDSLPSSPRRRGPILRSEAMWHGRR